MEGLKVFTCEYTDCACRCHATHVCTCRITEEEFAECKKFIKGKEVEVAILVSEHYPYREDAYEAPLAIINNPTYLESEEYKNPTKYRIKNEAILLKG